MTSFIAAGGSGRSASFIPAVPAAWSVTTIAFMVHLLVRGDTIAANRHEALLEYRPAMIQSDLAARAVQRVRKLSPRIDGA
jgi:hypothetical protein